MIIGRGDIAAALRDANYRSETVYFAAGVSNSQETRETEYQREIDLLRRQPRDQRLVYFSSLCVFYLQSRYAQHKLYAESFIKQWFPRYCIVRIGNITWGSNPHTLINTLRAAEAPVIRPVYRYVVDRAEFLYWINMIPAFNCELNIPGRRMLVEDIYREFVLAERETA